MACGSSVSALVNRNGPGSAASSTFESIVKPADATGGMEDKECLEVIVEEESLGWRDQLP
ncbi:hypothetical protein F5B18DRAFT_657291 [Nemania serpens]|nr:hypothetical protein F5B18DRAFT_657291 [Nemania serpens]